MNTTDLVQFPSAGIPERQATRRPPLAPSRYELAAPVRNSIFRARQYLIDEQRLDGSWARPTALDTTSRAKLVLLDALLGCGPSASGESPTIAIFGDQLRTGGWSLAPNNSVDLDASVLAYFALKLLSENANQPDMCRARQAIREHGGADACGATTRLWLAMLGQIDFEHCPPIAPEWLLMPAFTNWFSAADELRLAALSVAWTLRPRRELELARGVRELFVELPQRWPKLTAYFAAGTSTATSGIWTRCERFSFLPLRKRALARANFLLTEAASESSWSAAAVDDLVWQRIALHMLGHAETSRVIARCDRRLQHFDCAEADDARSCSETSLTTDTARVVEALVASGVGIDEPPVAAAVGWLATHRLAEAHKSRSVSEIAAILQAGNYLVNAAPFAGGSLPPRIQLAAEDLPNPACCDGPRSAVDLANSIEKQLQECRRLQQGDGGWNLTVEANWNQRWRGMLHAHFRSTNMASDPEATGRMLELMSHQYRESNTTAIDRAVAFLHSGQRGDGSWTATGGRLIDSTSWAVRGLVAAGAQKSKAAIDAGVNWLLIHEREAGGWREPDECGTVGEEPSTAESDVPQTSAVVLALVAAKLANHEATRRGIDVLVGWQLSGDLDRAAWSLLALARWAVAVERQAQVDQPTELRLVCCDAL